jgi:uncharacterized protein (DUF433 family)
MNRYKFSNFKFLVRNVRMEAIVQQFEARNGRVYIAGTNIKAKLVASMHIHGERPIADVMAHYNISAAQVHAALRHYYANHEKIEAEFGEAAEIARRHANDTL